MLLNKNGAHFLRKITSGEIIINPKDRILLALAYAKALKELHDQNKILLNLRPRNSTITINDSQISITLLDIDNAKERRDKINLKDYTTKIKFVAPEIFSQNYTASFRSDIFSLGLIFAYFFFSGNRIVSGRKKHSHHISFSIERSSNGLLDFTRLDFYKQYFIEKPFCELIAMMLSKDITDRPYVDKIITELEAILRTPQMMGISPQIFLVCQQKNWHLHEPYDADQEDNDND